jgi:serine/threonine-protein kinase
MSIPTTLGRYEIEIPLGSGSYATVYRARDTRLNRVVALKVLKSTLAGDEEIAGRFLREAQTAANLIHPQIAWVLDLGEADGQHYIAMRYVDGMPLDKVIKTRGRLIWRDALQVIVQIGAALEFAHERGIIHRDIKPQNILYSAADGAVLTDFGLVKATQSSGTRTRTDAVLGTPQYIAPEMWNGQPASPASDQYALACVFVEILTGQPLYAGKSLIEIIGSHMKALDVRLWDTWPEDVPAGIDPVLQRALARQPDHRFADIRTLIENIQQVDETARQSALQNKSVLQHLHPGLPERPLHPPENTVPRDRSQMPAIPAEKRARGKDVIPTEEVEPRGVRQKLRDMVAKSAAPEARPTYQLTMTVGPARGKVFALTQARMVLGRNPACDIVIDELEVSRKHAVISQVAQGYLLEDLQSTNGTFVNNQQIRRLQLLNAGDEIGLGKNVRLSFQKSDIMQ